MSSRSCCLSPAASIELSRGVLGLGLAVIVQQRPGFRLAGRYYPLQLGVFHPYLELGATAFLPSVAGRAAVGAEVVFEELQVLRLFTDVAVEHFFNSSPGYDSNALLLSLGARWDWGL